MRAAFDYALYKGSGRWRQRWQKSARFLFIKDVRREEVGRLGPARGMTFIEACDLLSWNPQYVRGLVRKMGRGDAQKIELDWFLDECTETSFPGLHLDECYCPRSIDGPDISEMLEV